MSLTKVNSAAVQNSTVNSTPIGQTAQATGQFTTPLSTDNSTNAATTAWAKLGLAILLATNGYIKFPACLGGLVVQWGTVGYMPDNSTVTGSFPIVFPTSVFIFIPGGGGGRVTSGNPQPIAGNFTSTSQFQMIATGSGPSTVGSWIAIGH